MKSSQIASRNFLQSNHSDFIVDYFSQKIALNKDQKQKRIEFIFGAKFTLQIIFMDFPNPCLL